MPEACKIIADVKSAEVLIDPMRRLILDLLAENELTEADLAERLELSESSVNHHLKELKRTGLIHVVRTEAESHGILQKFYRSTALLVMVDYQKMPVRIRRYSFALYLERVRGALSALLLDSKSSQPLSWETLEQLSDAMAEEVVSVARTVKLPPEGSTREGLILQIYSEALRRLSSDPEKGKVIANLMGRSAGQRV